MNQKNNSLFVNKEYRFLILKNHSYEIIFESPNESFIIEIRKYIKSELIICEEKEYNFSVAQNIIEIEHKIGVKNITIKCTEKSDDTFIFVFLYSKNSNNFKVIDYNNTILTLNSGEHYLIKLDKKYKDKMLSITREDGIKDDFYYKFIILTFRKKCPKFWFFLFSRAISFFYFFWKLDNGLLEEENYYLFFELIKGGDFDFSFGNKVAKRDDGDKYRIKSDENYVFKFNYSAANSYSDFVQVIPCENSEIKILEKTKSETNVNTISNYYSFRMNRFKDRINVYGNSYIMFYREYVIINFNYLTSLNVAD